MPAAMVGDCSALVKDDTAADDDCLVLQQYAVALGAVWVADHDSTDAAVVQLLPLLFRCVGVGCCPKGPHVGDIWLLTEEQLPRCL